MEVILKARLKRPGERMASNNATKLKVSTRDDAWHICSVGSKATIPKPYINLHPLRLHYDSLNDHCQWRAVWIILPDHFNSIALYLIAYQTHLEFAPSSLA